MAPVLEQTSRFTSPLFFWEALRGARKGSQYIPRLVLPAVLLTILLITFAGKDITQSTASYFAESAFNLYITIQYLAVGFLTPLHVAGTIVEERQRGTLMLLLTTHLTARDIVFGKMLGSTVPILAVMLAGVPVLALLQLFGGVDFVKVIWHTALALLMMLAFAMYAIRSSTQYSSAGSALFFTYMKIVGGLFMFYILSALTVLFFWLALRPYLISNSSYPLEWFMTLLVIYNLLVAYLFSYRGAIAAFQVQHRSKLLFTSEKPVENSSRARALGYVNELKQQKAERQVETVVEGIPAEIEAPLQGEPMKPADRPLPVPAIKDKQRPLVWKVIFFPDRSTLVASTLMLGLSVLLIVIISVANQFHPQISSPKDISFWLIRLTLFLYMALITFRACSVLAEERVQKTLLSLLTLPMTHSQLVIDMAWGCVWRYRWLALVCLLPLLEAIIFDSVAMVLVLGTMLSQLVLLVMVSLFLSIVLQTAMRARMVIITVVLALAFNANAFLRNVDGAQTLLFVPFQRYPYPFIHSGADAIQLVAMLFLYWLVHWLLAYLLLVLTVKHLRRYAARS